jgi:hypothetical protein
MVLGISLAAYTLIHVLISLAGIGSGLIVVYGLLRGRRLNGWTAIFLLTTVLTSVTGFGFPFTHLTPGLIVGIISLVVLTPAILGRYVFSLQGGWRTTYVIGSMIALYLNVFVLVVQSFEKVPILHALAPTQKESPFFVAQLLAMALFIVLTVLGVRRFHPVSALASRAAAAS